MTKDAKGMAGVRSRDKLTGRLRRKRADTKIITLDKDYKRDLSSNEDLQLGTVLKRKRKGSLKKLLK
ncbi:hypothetical protein HYT01_02605 [Candidatus Giovannonibacteria bacterium]|nr:hypothetical protein [Candidatus Giovannonibacteria bacterium]